MTVVGRVLLPVIAAVLLMFVWSAPATAAPPNPSMPGAVAVTASAADYEVTFRVTNNWWKKLTICGVFLFPATADPNRDQPKAIWSPVDIEAGQTKQTRILRFPLTNGNYTVNWNCTASENGRDIWWGTRSPFQPTDRNWVPTAQPTPVVIAAPTCLGSACIPQGLGF